MARPALKNFRRIVVKVGSSLLIDSAAGEVREAWLKALAADIAKLHHDGCEVLIVSSGSIALGRSRLKLPRGALKLEESQAAAAVGQIRLAQAWADAFQSHTLTVAQILVLADSASPPTTNLRRFISILPCDGADLKAVRGLG